MARNKVQFQRGLSDVEFERLYGTEEKCREALFSWRWPARLRVSGLRGLGALRAGEACTVAVQRLPHPDVADGGHDRWSQSCARLIAIRLRRWPSGTGSANRQSTRGAGVLARFRWTMYAGYAELFWNSVCHWLCSAVRRGIRSGET